MNINITTFTSPFSFFCLAKDGKTCFNISLANKIDTNNINVPLSYKSGIADVNHGQYVAVMWQDKWTRGIVNMESQFLIWLIDYGFYLRVNEKTIYINLPNEYKKHPSKIFEASIHGVTPIDKTLSEDCQIKNVISNLWNRASIEKAQNLIESASSLHFVPVAVLSTDHNDVVIGDLYLEMNNRKLINIIDELKKWPVYLENNKEIYIQNLSKYYVGRRRHRACLLKPDIPDIPTVTLQTTLNEYSTICEKAPALDTLSESDEFQEDGSTVLDCEGNYKKQKKSYKLTAAEIEKYSNMYVNVAGKEYNVLNVLLNKSRDLYMCERYKDYDVKGMGRGVTKSYLKACLL